MSIKIYSQQEKKELRNITKQARKISCAEIADNVYGLTLYRSKTSNRYLRCYEHPSLQFDLQKNQVFYNAKTTHGMGPYDFMAFYENISLMQAREKLNGYYAERDPRHLQLYYYNRTNDEVYIHQGMTLPSKDETMQDTIRSYLHKFNIHDEIIDSMIMGSNIYQATNKNLVVVGFDEMEKPTFSVIYSTDPDNPYKVECQGSFTKLGLLKTNAEENKLVICDSPINTMAYLSLYPEDDVLASIDKEHLLETIEYNFNSEERINKHYKNVIFALGDTEQDKDLIKRIIENDKANEHYKSLIAVASELDTDRTIKEYIRDTSGIGIIDAKYDVEYKDMKELLAEAQKQNNALQSIMESAKEIEKEMEEQEL